MAKVTMKQMLEAGVHFGHKTKFWHPKMAPYIYGARNYIHIINLEETLPRFNDALNFVSSIISQGGKILFVGTKRSAGEAIKNEATRCEMPYVNNRWLGGMMTNFKTIKSSIKRLKDLEFLQEDNFSQFNKKEALTMTRELEKLKQSLGGIKDMQSIPDAIFVVDIGYEKNAVNEAKKLHIPIIGIVDTNYNPDGIDYMIPGNDDSIRSITFYAREIANTIVETKAVIAATSGQAKSKVAVVEKKPKTQKQEEKTDIVEKVEEVKESKKAIAKETKEVSSEKDTKNPTTKNKAKTKTKKTTTKKAEESKNNGEK